jgi:hypothetical protein
MEPSIITPPVSRGHSAQVEMTLIVNDVSYRVRSLGPDYVFLEKSGDHAPVQGTLVIEIDGDEQRKHIFLPKGLSKNEREASIEFLS